MPTRDDIEKARAKGHEMAILTLVIDEFGTVIGVQENGLPLVYDQQSRADRPPEKKDMDAGAFSIRSGSPCTWRKINGRWYCI
jgi:hypothetical protein